LKRKATVLLESQREKGDEQMAHLSSSGQSAQAGQGAEPQQQGPNSQRTEMQQERRGNKKTNAGMGTRQKGDETGRGAAGVVLRAWRSINHQKPNQKKQRLDHDRGPPKSKLGEAMREVGGRKRKSTWGVHKGGTRNGEESGCQGVPKNPCRRHRERMAEKNHT